jgi:hypothetical protein
LRTTCAAGCKIRNWISVLRRLTALRRSHPQIASHAQGLRQKLRRTHRSCSRMETEQPATGFASAVELASTAFSIASSMSNSRQFLAVDAVSSLVDGVPPILPCRRRGVPVAFCGCGSRRATCADRCHSQRLLAQRVDTHSDRRSHLRPLQAQFRNWEKAGERLVRPVDWVLWT